jgi:hypothetical protein
MRCQNRRVVSLRQPLSAVVSHRTPNDRMTVFIEAPRDIVR